MRKAAGQFEGGEDGKIGRDRWYFLDAAQVEVPELAASLANVFVAAGTGVDLRGTWWWRDFIGVSGVTLTEGGAPFAALKCGVETWAGTFHLTKDGAPSEWILEGVAATFSRWARMGSTYEPIDPFAPPPAETQQVIMPPSYREVVPDIDYSLHVPEFPITRWNPTFGATREEVEAKIEVEIRALRKHLKSELRRIEEDAVKGGLKKAGARYNRDHFKWAAMFQVGGMKAISIAALLERTDEATVRRAAFPIIEGIGLALRKDVIGRPRKKSRISPSR